VVLHCQRSRTKKPETTILTGTAKFDSILFLIGSGYRKLARPP
jgi:hypothetical protein